MRLSSLAPSFSAQFASPFSDCSDVLVFTLFFTVKNNKQAACVATKKGGKIAGSVLTLVNHLSGFSLD